jgi:hypothetical protein
VRNSATHSASLCGRLVRCSHTAHTSSGSGPYTLIVSPCYFHMLTGRWLSAILGAGYYCTPCWYSACRRSTRLLHRALAASLVILITPFCVARLHLNPNASIPKPVHFCKGFWPSFVLQLGP